MRRAGARGLAALVVALGWLAGAAGARATPAGPTTRVDLARGPILTSSRIMGLGGAFVGVGEGIDAVFRNPAALANRGDAATSWLDGDFTLDWLIVPGSEIDWDGDGRPAADAVEFRAINAGLIIQGGPVGLGALGTFYGWSGAGFDVTHVDGLFGLGIAFDDGAWLVGLGATGSTLSVTTGDSATDLSGTGVDAGVLWRPHDLDLRLGARVRSGMRLEGATTDVTGLLAGEPGLVGIVPFQVALGGSIALFADPWRRYNPRLRAAVDRRPGEAEVLRDAASEADRRYLLTSVELVLQGPSNGRSLESEVARRARSTSPASTASGEGFSLTLHAGIEGELLDRRLRSRFGAYLEPVRVDGGFPLRVHLTGGAELRLVELVFDWKANFAFDVAPGWVNVTLGVGFWR